MPGLSIRANGSSLPLVLSERIAHVRGGGRAVASVKFFVVRPQDVLAFFFKKGATLPLPLVGVSQRETSDRGGRARKGDSHGSGR